MSFETNNLRLDVYLKKKHQVLNYKKIDKRSLREKLTPEKILEKRLIISLLNFGVNKPNLVISELKKIKNIENLNSDLIVCVYMYFVGKNLDIDLVVSDFDTDFDKQLKNIAKKNIFPKLETPFQKYLFRQDFIIYLLLVTKNDEEEVEETYIEDEDYVEDENNDNYEEELNSYY